MDLFEQVAIEAMAACNDSYKIICEREQVKGVGEVKVLRYEQLLEHALIKLGAEEVDTIEARSTHITMSGMTVKSHFVSSTT